VSTSGLAIEALLDFVFLLECALDLSVNPAGTNFLEVPLLERRLKGSYLEFSERLLILHLKKSAVFITAVSTVFHELA